MNPIDVLAVERTARSAGNLHGLNFLQVASLATMAGLDAWRAEHDKDYHSGDLTNKIKESFKTPIPFDETKHWREASGYTYGAEMPQLMWGIGFGLPETLPSGWMTGRDIGLRLLCAIPRLGNRAVGADIDHPVLSMRVGIKRRSIEKGLKPGSLHLQVGEEQVDEYGKDLNPRASQELLIIVRKFIELTSSQDAIGQALHAIPSETGTSRRRKLLRRSSARS